MRSTIIIVVTCLVAMLLPADAAGSIIVRDTDGVFVSGTKGTIKAGVDGGGWKSILAGTFDLEADYGDGYVPLLTYCIDLDQYLGARASGREYELEPLTTPGLGINEIEAELMETLWFNAFDLSMTDKVHAGAFQVILWELTRDDDLDLLAGDFRLNIGHGHTNNVYDLASDWLGYIEDDTWTLSMDLAALTSPSHQDLVTHLPEPTTWAMLGVGGVLMLVRRRR